MNKTVPSHFFAQFLFVVIVSTGVINGVHAESLWDPDFSGYLSKTNTLQPGDIVTVLIESDFKLSFVSSSVNSKSLTLEFSGGEYPDLFSFMPNAKSQDQTNLRGKEEHSFKSDVVTRITRIDRPNQAFITGTKSIVVDGKNESLTLSGYINPKDIGTDRTVLFSKVADSRLVLNTFLEPDRDILTERDIEEIITGLQGGSVPAPQGTPSPLSGSSTQTQRRFTLSDAKKKELFFRYVNRIIDLIF